MGQPGYGVDQAYLLYRRAGSKIGHNAHLFALIGADIDRMQSAQFQGYDKPVLDLENGALAVKNVPVPRHSYFLPWLTDRKAIFGSLRMIEFARRFRHRAGAEPSAPGEPAGGEDGRRKTREVLRLLFADLKRLNGDRGSELILVYLPALSDFQAGGSGGWLAMIEEEARALQVPLINVLARFQALPPEGARTLFILPGRGTYPGVNHLNEHGNAFVAKVIYEELRSRADRRNR